MNRAGEKPPPLPAPPPRRRGPAAPLPGQPRQSRAGGAEPGWGGPSPPGGPRLPPRGFHPSPPAPRPPPIITKTGKGRRGPTWVRSAEHQLEAEEAAEGGAEGPRSRRAAPHARRCPAPLRSGPRCSLGGAGTAEGRAGGGGGGGTPKREREGRRGGKKFKKKKKKRLNNI